MEGFHRHHPAQKIGKVRQIHSHLLRDEVDAGLFFLVFPIYQVPSLAPIPMWRELGIGLCGRSC